MNTLLERLGVSWAGLLRDLFLIVVGILIAFGLEAWWAGSQERRRVAESLAAVRAELESNLAQLDTVLGRNEASVRSVREILGTDPSEEAPPLVTGVLFDPSTGALDAFLMSGELAEIRSLELRAALAGWPGVVGQLDADNENWLDLVRRLSARWAEVGLASRMLGVPGTEPFDPRDLTRDPLAYELFASEAIALADLVDEQRLVRERLVRLLDLLREDS